MTSAASNDTAMAMLLLSAKYWREVVTAPKTVIGNPTAIRMPRTTVTHWAVVTWPAERFGKRGTTQAASAAVASKATAPIAA